MIGGDGGGVRGSLSAAGISILAGDASDAGVLAVR